MSPALLAVTDETLVGSSAALAITAVLTAVREVVGWLRDRDAQRFNTEKALLAQRVEDLSARLTNTETDHAGTKDRLAKAERDVEECRQDRHELRDELNAAKATLDSLKARELTRHPEITGD